MEDQKPAEREGYLFAAVAAGGRFLFLFSTLPLCFPPALSLLVSIFFPCVCVACALWCFPSFVSLPFISPSYRFSLLFSLSLGCSL